MDEQKGRDSRTATTPPWIEVRASDVVLAVHLQPGARRTAVVGTHGDRLKIAVMAAPVDGRANDALLDFLANELGVARTSVALLSGAHSRNKRVAVRGELHAARVVAALLRQ